LSDTRSPKSPDSTPLPPIRDTVTPGETIDFQVDEVLFEGRSPYQGIQVVKLHTHGRALVLDGNIQSTEQDEHLYHESLVHPAMLLVDEPGPRDVLILGGGEGATLREVLRCSSVRRAVMVDLDEMVVEACRTFLPQHHQGAFDDPRATVICQDAEQFLADDASRFDVIVFDLVDPDDAGPAAHLFTPEFFGVIHDHLTDGGVMTMQYGPVYLDHTGSARRVIDALSTAFDGVWPGCVFIPSYHGAWGIAVAGDRLPPFDASLVDLLKPRAARRLALPARAVDAAFIPTLFTLPRDLREELGAR